MNVHFLNSFASQKTKMIHKWYFIKWIYIQHKTPGDRPPYLSKHSVQYNLRNLLNISFVQGTVHRAETPLSRFHDLVEVAVFMRHFYTRHGDDCYKEAHRSIYTHMTVL